MIQLTYDQNGVTLELKSRQSLLDRLLSRRTDPDFDHDSRLSFALADLRATAEETGDQVEIESDRIRLSHRTLSALSSETADALGLPQLVDLTLRTDVMGQIGSPGFRLTRDWVRAGRKEIAHRTGAFLETSGDGADGLRRLPAWMLDAIEVADRFQAGSDLDEHWEALARFRRALEPGVRMDRADAEARLGMTDFLSGLEVTLTDRFSISPRGEDQFAIIPFLGETVEAAERGGEQISEAEAEVQEGRLRAFQDKAFARGARPAYKLGAQSYLVVDPEAAPVLKAMTDMQRADPVTRAAFVRNPRQRITEAVTHHLRSRGKLDGLSPAQEQELIEQAAEPAFVETREYSERVIGLTVYEKPALEITGSGTTWLPEAFTGAAAEKIEAMPPDQVERLIHQVDAAIAAGEPSVNVNGAEIPATPTSRAALGSVGIQRALMRLAQAWIMALKHVSVFSDRSAMRLNSLSLQKKFSTRWRHLYISSSISRGRLRCGRCEMQIVAPRVFISSTIQLLSKALSARIASKEMSRISGATPTVS